MTFLTPIRPIGGVLPFTSPQAKYSVSHHRVGGNGPGMSNAHEVTEDIVFNLISIQYHASQGSHLYERFVTDAESADHPEVVEFIEGCQTTDAEWAQRCHELLVELTAETR